MGLSAGGTRCSASGSAGPWHGVRCVALGGGCCHQTHSRDEGEKKKSTKKYSSEYRAGTSAPVWIVVYWFQCYCIGLQQRAPARCQCRLTTATVLTVWPVQSYSADKEYTQEESKQDPELNYIICPNPTRSKEAAKSAYAYPNNFRCFHCIYWGKKKKRERRKKKKEEQSSEALSCCK